MKALKSITPMSFWRWTLDITWPQRQVPSSTPRARLICHQTHTGEIEPVRGITTSMHHKDLCLFLKELQERVRGVPRGLVKDAGVLEVRRTWVRFLTAGVYLVAVSTAAPSPSQRRRETPVLNGVENRRVELARGEAGRARRDAAPRPAYSVES